MLMMMLRGGKKRKISTEKLAFTAAQVESRFGGMVEFRRALILVFSAFAPSRTGVREIRYCNN